jgi:hypothetical protein
MGFEIYNLSSTPNFIKVMKSRKMVKGGTLARMGKMRDVSVHRRVILNKYCMAVWAGLNWLRIATSDRVL